MKSVWIGVSSLRAGEVAHRRASPAAYLTDRSKGSGRGPGPLLHGGQQRVCRRTRGMWVLPRDQLTVGDHMNSPVCRFRKDSTQLQHLVFDKERYDLGEAYIFLL